MVSYNRLSIFSINLLLLGSLFLFPLASSLHIAPRPYFQTLRSCHFDKIYQLGDSLSDTGNLIRETPVGAHTAFARLPYGQSFSENATGRCSDGLLMIDFIALSSGLPFLKPYRAHTENNTHEFTNGVNFAVAGSTALPVEILAARNIYSPVTRSSLNVQLDWMQSFFNSTCPLNDTTCMKNLNKNALFMVGEIGGNDYNYALFQGKTMEELNNMVPDVVGAIANAVRRVINEFGATRVVVPGNFPIGCLPIYLTGFKTNDSTAYDESHCLKGLNEFARYHNHVLQDAIQDLKKEYPKVSIAYGDYYNALRWVLRRAPYAGFDRDSLQKACCGTGGDYNFNLTKMCGAPGVEVCPEPDKYVSWDGVHLTQNAYRLMSGWLIRNLLPNLQCSRAS